MAGGPEKADGILGALEGATGGGAPGNGRAPVIEIEGLRRSFGEQEVLCGVDLVVERGTTTVILGMSGSGKSTLLKHIVGLLRPDAGRVLVEGHDVASVSRRELAGIRSRIGYVFQGAALLASLTGEENVALPLGERERLGRPEAAGRVREVLELVHLSDAGRKRPDELSGGMRKRAGLARALVTRPEIILYDEPTTGLDPVICRSINELILEIKLKLGVPAIVISHDVPGARLVSDRMALLHEGRIAAEGTPDEMMANTDPVVWRFLRGETSGPPAGLSAGALTQAGG